MKPIAVALANEAGIKGGCDCEEERNVRPLPLPLAETEVSAVRAVAVPFASAPMVQSNPRVFSIGDADRCPRRCG
jgi:hypothetical protein